MMKIFLDTNVVLDVLSKRPAFYQNSARVLSCAEEKKITAMIAAHSVTTIYYLMAKHFGRAQANAALLDLLNLVKVAAIDEDVLKEALALNWKDYEDAVQTVAAMKSKCTYFITRNVKDFPHLTLDVLTPEEFLEYNNKIVVARY